MRASYVPSVPASTRGGGADKDWSPGLAVPGALPGGSPALPPPLLCCLPPEQQGPLPHGALGSGPRRPLPAGLQFRVCRELMGTEELTLTPAGGRDQGSPRGLVVLSVLGYGGVSGPVSSPHEADALRTAI